MLVTFLPKLAIYSNYHLVSSFGTSRKLSCLDAHTFLRAIKLVFSIKRCGLPDRKIYLSASSTSGWDVIIECSGPLDDVTSFATREAAESYARRKSIQLRYDVIVVGRDGVRRRLSDVANADIDAAENPATQKLDQN